jgi:hypothetical protein
MKRLQRLHSSKLDLLIGIVLVIVGLNYASKSDAPYHVQNDGYNVTGAFITMIGGVVLGSYATNKSKK